MVKVVNPVDFRVKKSIYLRFIFVLFAMSIPSFADSYKIVDSKDVIAIEQSGLIVHINKQGFRFSFQRPDGSVIVKPHKTSGIQLGPLDNLMNVESGEYIGFISNAHTFRVKTASGLSANITVKINQNHVWFDIKADTDKEIAIVAKTAGTSPGYGLGDLVANRACPGGLQSMISEELGTEITGFEKEDFYAQMPLVRCMTNFARLLIS